MAESIKELRGRIRSVGNTRQLTKAMELAASARVKGAMERAEQARLFWEEAAREARRSCARVREENAAEQKKYLIVMSGDRGLAGGYNINVFQTAEKILRAGGYQLIAVGKKAAERFRYREDCRDLSGMTKEVCLAMGKDLAEQYERGEFDRLELVYTELVNPLIQNARHAVILPVVPEGEALLYEPSREAVQRAVMPLYLGGWIHYAAVQSYASELCARRNAMDTATRNADEMLEELKLRYNRARQGAITREITEIVAGAGGSST